MCVNDFGPPRAVAVHTIQSIQDSFRGATKSHAIGTLRSNDADGNGNVKKPKGLINKTTNLHVHHAFIYISFLFLHDFEVKMPNFAFYVGCKQASKKFYFSFWAWIWSLETQLQETSGRFAYIWHSKRVGIIAIKTERTQIHFLSDVLVVARRVVGSYGPLTTTVVCLHPSWTSYEEISLGSPPATLK